jgi:hypothetical protein
MSQSTHASLSLTTATPKNGGIMTMARPISSAVVRAPPRAVPLTERLGHMSDVTLMACDDGANRLSTALLAVLMMTGSDMYAESLYTAVYDTACCSHYKKETSVTTRLLHACTSHSPQVSAETALKLLSDYQSGSRLHWSQLTTGCERSIFNRSIPT